MRDEAPLPLRELALDVTVAAGLAVVLLVLDFAGFDTVPVLAALVASVVPWLLARRRRVKVHVVVEGLLALPIDLVRALAPLVLPALVVLLYAARVLGPAGEVALGVVTGAVAALVAAREARGVRETIAGFASRRLVAIVGVAGVLVAAAVVAVLVMTELAPGLKQYGGRPATLEAGALGLLSAAFVLRLLWLPSTRPERWFVVAALLVVWARFVVVWTGFPGGWIADRLFDWFHAGDRWWALAALVVVGLCAALEAARWLDRPAVRGEADAAAGFAGFARRWGFLAALTSTAVFVVAFVAATVEARAPELAHRAPRAVEVAGESVSAADPAAIARAFRPTIQLAPHELWAPSSVGPYLRNTNLHDETTGEIVDPSPVELKALARRCADPTEPDCYYLSCAAGHPACTRPSRARDPVVVYAHVVSRDDRKQRRFFAGGPGWTADITTIVEYWFFYPYDRWEAVTPVGYLVQQHEGDWESVVILIAGSVPRVIAYSSHCGGHWFRWSDAERDGTHPVVAVALGSHANYRHEWSGRPPDWGSCRNVPEGATWALTFASNVRDTTGKGRRIDWSKVVVRTVPDDAPLLAYPGRWGRQDTTTIGGVGAAHASHEVGTPGRGPTSPGIKELWNKPLATIFEPPWHEGDTGR